MREISEQEQLARLVRSGGSEDEPVDTAFLLESALKNSLGSVSEKVLERTKREIESNGDYVESNSSAKMNRTANANNSMPSGMSSEKLLITLYDIREDLIGAFEASGVNTRIASKLSPGIEKVEGFIKTLGGDIEKFIPINHISGLSAPNQIKNAEKIIETTIQCYTLGKVEEAKIKEGGKMIHIIFSGTSGDTQYKAFGDISSEEWMGNEAIDYIYTPGEGNMTVKAYESGRWLVKNAAGNNRYKVLWTLEEKQISKSSSESKTEPSPIVVSKEIKNKDLKKEGEEINLVNNVDEEIGEPIQDK